LRRHVGDHGFDAVIPDASPDKGPSALGTIGMPAIMSGLTPAFSTEAREGDHFSLRWSFFRRVGHPVSGLGVSFRAPDDDAIAKRPEFH
jgi:hypothetical protein